MAASCEKKRGSNLMPINPALDVEKQKEFNQKVNEVVIKNKGKLGKKKQTMDKRKGCLKLTNIPWGFFEDEMRQYFSQFGIVEAVKLVRSVKTGKSKGIAYIRFREKAVAEIAAETMNNYLMFDKLLKCKLMEKVPRSLFHQQIFPTLTMKERAMQRSHTITPKQELKKHRKFLEAFFEKRKQLEAKGITYTLENLDELKKICRPQETKKGKKKQRTKEKKQEKETTVKKLEKTVEKANDENVSRKTLQNRKRRIKQQKKKEMHQSTGETQEKKVEGKQKRKISDQSHSGADNSSPKKRKDNKKEKSGGKSTPKGRKDNMNGSLNSSTGSTGDGEEVVFEAADGSDDEISFRTPIKSSSSRRHSTIELVRSTGKVKSTSRLMLSAMEKNMTNSISKLSKKRHSLPASTHKSLITKPATPLPSSGKKAKKAN